MERAGYDDADDAPRGLRRGVRPVDVLQEHGLQQPGRLPGGHRAVFAAKPSHLLFALEDDRLAGVILSGQDGRRGYIYHMAIAEDFRRRGIATALLDRCLEALRAEGIRTDR